MSCFEYLLRGSSSADVNIVLSSGRIEPPLDLDEHDDDARLVDDAPEAHWRKLELAFLTEHLILRSQDKFVAGRYLA